MSYRFHFEVPLRNLPMLLEGLAQTWKITALSLLFGFVLALVVVGLRISKVKPLAIVAGVYVELFRNTPAVVQLFLIYFGLPVVGVQLNPFTAALIALTLNHGAYLTEIIRSGIESVKHAQWEAAYSLGLGFAQVLRHIVYPIGLKAAYPAMCNQFIIGLLWVSLVSVISAKELVYQASILNALTFRSFEIYITVGVLYVLNVLAFTAVLKIVGLVAFRRQIPSLQRMQQRIHVYVLHRYSRRKDKGMTA